MSRALLIVCVVSSSLVAGFVSADDKQREPISPRGEIIRPFNGRDFNGVYTWLKGTGRDDPKRVFQIEDGMIRISGDGNGGVITNDEYKDYHLTIEYKWGEKTYGSKTVRNSGLLLHASGPDGNAGNGAWLASIEVQLAQGCAGDFIVIRGKETDGTTIPVTITSDTVLGPDRRTRWKAGGMPTMYSGRQFWWSMHDPDFKELIDTRGKNDVESPLAEWTRVECICAEDRITVLVNGTPVNECYNVFPKAGKIILQSEGFEIYFRKFELRPLMKMP